MQENNSILNNTANNTINKANINQRTAIGRLLTYFRKTQNMAVYSMLSELKNYKLENQEFIINVTEEEYSTLEDLSEEFNMVLKTELNISCKIVKEVVAIDMDKELQNLRKWFGKSIPIRIHKK